MNRFRILILCVLLLALGGMTALFFYNEQKLEEQKQRVEQLAKEELITRQKLELELLRKKANQNAEKPEDTTLGNKNVAEEARIRQLEEENARLRQRSAASEEEAMLITQKTREKRDGDLKAEGEIAKAPILAKIESYDREQNLIILTPTGSEPFQKGQKLSVRRNNSILIDIIIDELDPESNKYIAEAQRNELFDTHIDLTLRPGDEVINPPAEVAIPLPDLSKPVPMEAIDVPMIPVE